MPVNSLRYSRRSLLRAAGACGAAALLPAPAPAAGLPRRSPRAAGVDPAAVEAFLAGVEARVGGLHSFMLLARGHVAAEGWWAPYGPEHPHMLYSLSKSFTSTAVGLAVAEGRLTVDSRVTSFFPNDLPSRLDPNLRAMRVRHLLSMATGHERDATAPMRAAADGNWAKAFLALPVEHEPGSRFVYNSAATYMLSAILHQVTGESLLSYLRPRLFAPLGIEHPTWESDPRGIHVGGWGLSIRTEDIARFGQLYLQQGRWNGRQLLPAAWVAEATSKQIANGANPNSDWNQGYGYQFWRCRHGAFRGDGAFGQYCVVMPEQEAVLAITSGVRDMQAVLDLAWTHLLPGLKSGGNGDGHSLQRRLAGLSVPTPTGQAPGATAARVSGHTYALESNPDGLRALTPVFRGDRCTLAWAGGRGERRLAAGADRWVRGTAPLALGGLFPGAAPAPVASRFAWTAEDTCTVTQCFYETPYVETVVLKFAGDGVTVQRSLNVSFGPRERPQLTGRRQGAA